MGLGSPVARLSQPWVVRRPDNKEALARGNTDMLAAAGNNYSQFICTVGGQTDRYAVRLFVSLNLAAALRGPV